MEGFASTTLKTPCAIGRFDHMGLIFFRNRREFDNFPGLWAAENVTDQIVLVQALHDQNDAPGSLII